MDKQISRIEDMELAFDRAKSALDKLESALGEYSAAADDIKKLSCYLNSSERLLDLKADEAGKLPCDLRRGVLSEDGIWDLLEQNDRLIAEMKEICL